MRFFRKSAAKVMAPNPFTEESTIGNILLRMRKITREQLLVAVGAQARTNEHLLGAILIELGAVSQVDVARALEIQAKMRGGERANAEMDLLEAVMTESAVCTKAVGDAIAASRQRAHDAGDDTGAFLRLVPKPA